MCQRVQAQLIPVDEVSAPIDSTDTSKSDVEADPMVCMLIKHFVVPVVLEAR